jgi:hypothetical protein
MDIQGTVGNSATGSDHTSCNGCPAITDTEYQLKSEDWCPRATQCLSRSKLNSVYGICISVHLILYMVSTNFHYSVAVKIWE